MSTRSSSAVPLIALASETSREVNQDRAYVADAGTARIALLAAGAGGSSAATAAADVAVAALLEVALEPDDVLDPGAWVRWLGEVDRHVRDERGAGEAAAVVAVITAHHVLGAGVGDSSALLCHGPQVTELTRDQPRKPLLGGPGATAAPFGPVPFRGTLIIASDGLLDHAPLARIAEVAAATSLAEVPSALVNLVRLRSGSLPDDVSVIAARPPEPP